MRITVRFFASQRETTGVTRQEFDLADGASAGDAFEAAAGLFPALRQAAGSTAFAINRDVCPPDAPLHEGDELALLPPVAGG